MKTRTKILLGTLCVGGLMILASGFTAVGVLVGTQWSKPAGVQLPAFADAATQGEMLSFATGPVTDTIEGLFVLDHQTGMLQCWVVNDQTGLLGAIYQFNVAAELQIEKAADADFVMTTGAINFIGNARIGNDQPARCICYVGDGNTGRVVGLGVYINRAMLAARAEQMGEMNVICRGFTRENSRLRDQ